MPFKDKARQREYDKAYKSRRRSAGWTKKGLDKRLTPIEFETADDCRRLIDEVVTETREADNAELSLEKKLRIKLRAIEIGLRVIEITDHERRIAALEEGAHDPTPVTD